MSALDADLAIVGAGPAGVACALAAARRGLQVLLFEQHHPACDKPCGEGIMPPGIDAMEQLGLHELISRGRPFEGLRYVIPDLPALEIPMARGGLSLQRPLLQAGLDEAVADQPGIHRLQGRAHASRLPQGYLLQNDHGEYRSASLVAADGAPGDTAAWLRGQREPRRPGRLGLRARFEPREPLDRVEIHLGRSCEVYLTPLPGGTVNAAMLFAAPPRQTTGPDGLLEAALSQTPSCLHRLGALITRPSSRRLDFHPPRCLAGQGTFLVGDAGGGVDPILGCGVAIALSSGILAAECATECLGGAPPGRAERRYARGYTRQARMRRRLAWTLRQMAPHPSVMGAVASMGRSFPGLLQLMVGIVTGPAPDRRAA